MNVNLIHTKFILIDPLGTNPITLTSSANWSVRSVTDNDENLLVIRGAKGVADIKRLFAHHRSRASVKRHFEEMQGAPGTAGMTESEKGRSWRPRDLSEDLKDWVPAQFRTGLGARHQATVFSGEFELISTQYPLRSGFSANE